MTDRDAVMTVDEVAAALRIGRRQCYEAVRNGEIPALRIGRSIRIPRAWLDRTLAGKREDGDE